MTMTFLAEISYYACNREPFLRLTREGFCTRETFADGAERKIIEALDLQADEEIVVAFTKRKIGQMTPLELATLFHETYERLAPQFGYTTQPETRTFDPESPNGRLMVAVCGKIQQHFGLMPPTEGCQHCGSKRPFHLVPSSNNHVCGILEICLDCGQVQGEWPYPKE